jgi:hypothetical protein
MGSQNAAYSFYSDYGNTIPFSQANTFETYYLSVSSIDLFGLVLRLLLPELQVIITSKSTARLPIQLLYLWLISKPLLCRKFRYYKKYCQKVLFRSKQTEIIDLTTS